MDSDGIDAAFRYPSLGLFTGAVEAPDLAGPMCRAYNRWLADYWSAEARHQVMASGSLGFCGMN